MVISTRSLLDHEKPKRHWEKTKLVFLMADGIGDQIDEFSFAINVELTNEYPLDQYDMSSYQSVRCKHCYSLLYNKKEQIAGICYPEHRSSIKALCLHKDEETGWICEQLIGHKTNHKQEIVDYKIWENKQ